MIGINGIPACANDFYMNGVLRNSWGFDGYITSDCAALCDPAFDEYIAKNGNGSWLVQVTTAITAGVDVNCGPTFGGYLGDFFLFLFVIFVSFCYLSYTNAISP